MQDIKNLFCDFKQSIIIPYHKNKELLFYVIKLLLKTIPDYIEIIIIANNANKEEIQIESPSPQIKIHKVAKSMLYSEAMNLALVTGIKNC